MTAIHEIKDWDWNYTAHPVESGVYEVTAQNEKHERYALRNVPFDIDRGWSCPVGHVVAWREPGPMEPHRGKATTLPTHTPSQGIEFTEENAKRG